MFGKFNRDTTFRFNSMALKGNNKAFNALIEDII